MMKENTLGGSIFCYRGLANDYCVKEAIESLIACCDRCVLLDIGSDDGTAELMKSYESETVKVILLTKEMWDAQKGETKLSYFANVAIEALDTDWQICLQADEVISERSFDAIREAINNPHAEAYFVTRLNLWGNSKYYLDVPDDRKPVGQTIIRIAKTKYRSVGDAQSLHSPIVNADYIDKIKIFHMGFIRSRYVHTEKIRYMLCEVFGHAETDKKVEAMNGVFDPFVHFTKEDLKPIPEPLPRFVQAWAESRDKINQVEI
jgi:glycosyltransferase involved in cell wall biosynthesis